MAMPAADSRSSATISGTEETARTKESHALVKAHATASTPSAIMGKKEGQMVSFAEARNSAAISAITDATENAIPAKIAFITTSDVTHVAITSKMPAILG